MTNPFRKLPLKATGWLLTVMLVAMLFFHLAAMAGAVPADRLWGGRLKSREDLLVFETVSLVVTGAALVLVLLRTGLAGFRKREVLRWVFAGFAALFAMNTAGNLTAVTWEERVFGTAATGVLTVLTLRLALKEAAQIKTA